MRFFIFKKLKASYVLQNLSVQMRYILLYKINKLLHYQIHSGNLVGDLIIDFQDDLPDVAFDDNPLFKRRLLPCGKIETNTDTSNRLLWFIEYQTISVEVSC